MKNDIENRLKHLRARELSEQERNQVWQNIRAGIRNLPLKSNHSLKIFNRKPMFNIALILLLLFGGSIATVSAADNAKPGDILFPVDRAIEDLQLKLSSDEKKTELKLKFARERVEEVEKIVADTENSSDAVADNESAMDDSATTTEDTTKPSGDRAHESDQRVEAAFSTALEFLAGVRQDLDEKGNEEAVNAIDSVIERLDGGIGSLKGSVKLKVENEKDKYKFELKLKDKEGKQEIKIEAKDDEVEVESESESKKEKHEDIDEEDNEDHDKNEKKKHEAHDEDEENHDTDSLS